MRERRRLVKTVFIIVLTVVIFPLSLSAQITFEKTYGGPDIESASSVRQTKDKGYVFTGTTQNVDLDVYIVKTDSFGDTLWTRTYGGTDWDYGWSILETSDSGYIVAGQTASFGSGGWDIYVLKTDSLGDTLWTRTYGGVLDDWGCSIQHTYDGCYIVTGRTKSSGAGDWDIYLLKIDSQGDSLWLKTYGGLSIDRGYSVQVTSDSGFIVAGYTNSFGAGGYDVYLIRTDSLGDTLWTKTHGGALNDYGYSVQQTMNEGYIITGKTNSFGQNITDVYLIKTDSLGDTLWTRTYYYNEWYPGGEDEGWSVCQTNNGGYIITGSCGEYFEFYESYVYLIKTDSLGDTLWTRTYGGWLGWDWSYSVQQTEDEGYIIAGQTYSFGNYSQAYLIKTDTLGNVGVEEKKKRQEIQAQLYLACSPNPFSQTTIIKYGITQQSSIANMKSTRGNRRKVSLKIYDVSGRLVRTLVDAIQDAGMYSVRWKGRNNTGQNLSSGIYFARFASDDFTTSRKLILMK